MPTKPFVRLGTSSPILGGKRQDKPDPDALSKRKTFFWSSCSGSMTSFVEFLKSFDADSRKRGKQFEHFVKWFLKNDPEWATQVEEVWLWDEYPGRWGPDCGIDLVFKVRSENVGSPSEMLFSDHDITKTDVDKFLSESNRKQIDHRLLIATTDRIGANARQVLDAQEKSVVRYLLAHFESAAVEFPTAYRAYRQANASHHQN